MNFTRGSKVVISFSVITTLLYIFSIYFRAAIYIERDDAFTGVTIFELIEAGLISLLVTLSIIFGMVALALILFGAKQTKIYSGVLIALYIALYIGWSPLYVVATNYNSLT